MTKEEFLKDQVIFGVMTAENFVGQMPPVHVCEQNHEGGAIWYDKYQQLIKAGQSGDCQHEVEQLNQNYQFTYSFEDVHSDFKTKQVQSETIMKNLREKKYEEGWIENHDQYSSQSFLNSLRIDLKSVKYGDRNLIMDIIKFNEMIFGQISQKDAKLDCFEN